MVRAFDPSLSPEMLRVFVRTLIGVVVLKLLSFCWFEHVAAIDYRR
jgi:hypothetical protein